MVDLVVAGPGSVGATRLGRATQVDIAEGLGVFALVGLAPDGPALVLQEELPDDFDPRPILDREAANRAEHAAIGQGRRVHARGAGAHLRGDARHLLLVFPRMLALGFAQRVCGANLGMRNRRCLELPGGPNQPHDAVMPARLGGLAFVTIGNRGPKTWSSNLATRHSQVIVTAAAQRRQEEDETNAPHGRRLRLKASRGQRSANERDINAPSSCHGVMDMPVTGQDNR